MVLLQEKETDWVGMKNKVWKCNPVQVRAATNPEALGAELLSVFTCKLQEPKINDRNVEIVPK